MTIEIKAEPRVAVGRKVKVLRRAGLIPAVLYGRGVKSTSLTTGAQEFNRIFQAAGETTLVDLAIGGQKHKVLIHDIARDPLSGAITHIDFFEVRMDEKLKAKVPLVFIGESPAVKTEDGILVRAIQELEVEAFPQYLPKEITVDISSLATFEDKIHVKNLKVNPQVKILAEADEVVALVAPPRSDKEMAELEGKLEEVVAEVPIAGQEEKKEEEAATTAPEEPTPPQS